MKGGTKTYLKQPDEQPFTFASFELNCCNIAGERAQYADWEGEKTKQNNAFFFLLSGSLIDLPVPCRPAVRSRMSAGTQASRHTGWVEVGERPPARGANTTHNDHAQANAEKHGQRSGRMWKLWKSKVS